MTGHYLYNSLDLQCAVDEGNLVRLQTLEENFLRRA